MILLRKLTVLRLKKRLLKHCLLLKFTPSYPDTINEAILLLMMQNHFSHHQKQNMILLFPNHPTHGSVVLPAYLHQSFILK